MITEVAAIIISSSLGFISGVMCVRLLQANHSPGKPESIHDRETLPEIHPPTLRSGTHIDEPLKQRLTFEVEWAAPVDVVDVSWPVNEGDNRVLITYRPHENACMTAEDMVAMLETAKRLLPTRWVPELIAKKSAI